MTPVFTLADGITALSAPDHPKLVFLDLNLGEESHGIETLERFQAANLHKARIVVFTADEAIETLRKCVNLGVAGVLLKGGDLDKMFVGINRILTGEFWMPEPVIMALANNPAPFPARSNDRFGLSPREWDVAKAMTRGLQNKQIAQELGKSPQYIAQVTKQVFYKLGVDNRTQAALLVAGESGE